MSEVKYEYQNEIKELKESFYQRHEDEINRYKGVIDSNHFFLLF